MEDKEKKLALQKAVGERVYHSRKLARMSKEEPVLEHLLCHLRQLSPVQRDMAVHMLHLAFRAAQELGPEE